MTDSSNLAVGAQALGAIGDNERKAVENMADSLGDSSNLAQGMAEESLQDFATEFVTAHPKIPLPALHAFINTLRRERAQQEAERLRVIDRLGAVISGLEAEKRELVEVLEKQICESCSNRIGWSGEFDDVQRSLGRGDWRDCSGCRRERRLLARVRTNETEKEPV